MTKFEYRVIWKRQHCKIKSKRFALLGNAKKYMLLLGPTPWEYWGAKADDYACCSGRECGCSGMTNREESIKARETMQEIEFIKLEKRKVDEWDYR